MVGENEFLQHPSINKSGVLLMNPVVVSFREAHLFSVVWEVADIHSEEDGAVYYREWPVIVGQLCKSIHRSEAEPFD